MSGVLTANLVLQKTKLDNLKHVRKLNVCGVHVSDISILRDAKNVEVLSLSVNEIHDLEPLSFCVNLREVYLRRNDITDMRQVLHLSKLPFLSSLTLSDNPITQDSNYRKFCIAALPSLVRFDDMDISLSERGDAEHTFPDLAFVAPPTHSSGSAASANNSVSLGTPPRPSVGSSQSPRGYEPPARMSTVEDFAASIPRRSTQATRSDPLARKFQELSSAFDDMPVGSSRGVGSKQGSRGVVQAAPVAAAPRASTHHQGPSEASVVAAVKLLLSDLSPAALLDIRRHMETLH